ncbi:hypothetical protein A6M14_01450 [Acinetobacter sp. Ac_877]|uniref:hypothetical protein n=1 Tax=Acinetobacter portensis TaxID=1839785 RepID=UPI00128B99E3|nr:hypothetical protein [Acinetobacter portensis]MPW41956.1 hypothetical protein [Acinetobacter portensis]
MKNYSIALLTLSLLVLVGCGSTASWKKNGISRYDMQNTLAKCRYDVGLAKVNAKEKKSMENNCMISQGYRFRK